MPPKACNLLSGTRTAKLQGMTDIAASDFRHPRRHVRLDTILRLRDAGLDSIPGGGAEILDDEVRYKIARLKCLTEDWINVHRTAHQIGPSSPSALRALSVSVNTARRPSAGSRRRRTMPARTSLSVSWLTAEWV